jgi:hypothetical protein
MSFYGVNKMPLTAAKTLSRSKMELFQLNKLFFDKNKNDLLKKYKNMFVAIWDEKVVDFDEDKIKLARRVYEEIGYLPIYIQKVQKEIPTVRIPSPKTIN